MRALNFVVYILAVCSLGLNLYFWFSEIPTLKKIIKDLNHENENLIKELKPQKNPIITDTSLVVVVSSDDIFQPGSVEISDRGAAKLDSIIYDVMKSGYNGIQIAVYTDKSPIETNRDRFPTNWELAASRATSVVRYFIKKGIPPDRLSAVSYGDSRAKGHGARDRIVEIRVY